MHCSMLAIWGGPGGDTFTPCGHSSLDLAAAAGIRPSTAESRAPGRPAAEAMVWVMVLCLVILSLFGCCMGSLHLRIVELEAAQRATRQLLQEALLQLHAAMAQLHEVQQLRRMDEADKDQRFAMTHHKFDRLARKGERAARKYWSGVAKLEVGLRQLYAAWTTVVAPLPLQPPPPAHPPPESEDPESSDGDEDIDMIR